VLLFSISGALGFLAPIFIVSLFTGIALVTTTVLAGLITALIFRTKADLQRFTTFGLVFAMGTSDLGVVWLAAVHILTVGVMWLLMVCGAIQYNGLLRYLSHAQMPENTLLASDGYPRVDSGEQK